MSAPVQLPLPARLHLLTSRARVVVAATGGATASPTAATARTKHSARCPPATPLCAVRAWPAWRARVRAVSRPPGAATAARIALTAATRAPSSAPPRPATRPCSGEPPRRRAYPASCSPLTVALVPRRCGDDKCIPPNLLCDTYADCADRSDENPYLCEYPPHAPLPRTRPLGRCTHRRVIARRSAAVGRVGVPAGRDAVPRRALRASRRLLPAW